MKINYIIATWSGQRINGYSDFNYYQSVLKRHILELNKIKNNIDQITIMKPFNPIHNTYYDIELNDKIKIIDCENKYQSYGQWMKAIELFLDDFDYFIFIEDDYVPGTHNFDKKLIEIYEEGSYLCSKISENYAVFHCEVSNGIISKNTIKKLFEKHKYNVWFDEYAKLNPYFIFHHTNYQVAFSRFLFENGIKLIDYRNQYLVDFYVHAKVWDYSLPNAKNNEKIFTPIQNILC
jgi:hypothetical protein